MKLVLLLALAACSRSDRAPSPTALSPEEVARARQPPGPVVVPESAPLIGLVVGVTDGWDQTTATLRSFTRVDDAWRAVGDPWPAVLGRAGLAWGRGLHGDGVPAGRPGPLKREGDGRSPAGVFAIGHAYGYAPRAPAGTQLHYIPVDVAHQCVDDPQSSFYNRIVDVRQVAVDWKSHEEMRRSDALYRWVVEVAHNATAQRDAGSCIFLHVWGGEGTTTAGCTAMAEGQLVGLVARLVPDARFVLLPRAEYEALRASLALPAL